MSRARPVITDIPNPHSLPDTMVDEMQQGALHGRHLMNRPHRYGLLKTVATLNAPVWGLLDDTSPDFEQLRPAFGMVRFPFDVGMARMPNNYPLAKPGDALAMMRDACRLPDRSFYAMRIPESGVKPDAQTKIAFFSYHGMVRFFEEQVRIFPERQTPIPSSAGARRAIIRAWHNRQNG